MLTDGESVGVVVDLGGNAESIFKSRLEVDLFPRWDVAHLSYDPLGHIDHAWDAKTDPHHMVVEDLGNGVDDVAEHHVGSLLGGHRPFLEFCDLVTSNGEGRDLGAAKIDADDCSFDHLTSVLRLKFIPFICAYPHRWQDATTQS